MKDILFQAILDNPDDDLSRLAYADWLLENGNRSDQEFGEFIQLQIEIARQEPEYYLSWDNLTRELGSAIRTHRRAAQLLHKSWGLPRVDLKCYWKAEFRRGFPHTVRCEESDWIKSIYKVVEFAPVCRVSLISKAPREFINDRQYVWIRRANPASYPFPDEIDKVLFDYFYMSDVLRQRSFDNLPEAHRALSQACLDYAHDKLKETTHVSPL